ncbi:endonuclease/exonuclease/phosphatase family protein [Wenxinia saemankumensis]|uniref:Metal-dependent hydrolase, endonuclease/exonuclease/phosphatase family n=1 Tax=Wenxinia saemankumensis TaxID=1447782 RepID=A0A1M6HF45_9RHOB|nr:endonuclease/exonuclease/phosphatase family protein [Wenxinia saemankumensis]SHJ20729.1 Metal-dependent hydrolase, endonuclease/exonuclease/phosphatase family [Wenxinia saemankumensis]
MTVTDTGPATGPSPAPSPPAPLRVVSWNVHRGRGGDGRVDPARILSTLGAEVCPAGSADILGLQEADEEVPPHGRILDVAGIEAATGLRSVHDRDGLRWGPRSDGFLGAILFLPPDWGLSHADVIDLPGHCHRGAIAVEARSPAGPVRVICTHLSLGQPLRIVQVRTLVQYAFRRPAMPTILLGDLNEWRPWGGLAFSPRVTGCRLSGPCAPSFPVGRPILPLDRILCDRPGAVTGFEVLDGRGIRAASDHRPIRARVAPFGPADRSGGAAT